MIDVTQLLAEIETGRESASEELLPLVYDELRKLAKVRMANERIDHTLQTTALVHEAYIRLVDNSRAQQWQSRCHFFSAAAEAMRRILVEHARQKLGKQRGGDRERIELHDGFEKEVHNPELVLEVSEALELLARSDSQAAELVKLHCFAGFSIPDAAAVLGIPISSAYVDWTYAKAMMGRLLSD